MGFGRTVTSMVLMAAWAAAGVPLAAHARVHPSQDRKQSYFLALEAKNRFSDEDRAVASRYLAERRAGPNRTPPAMARRLTETGVWTLAYLPYAQAVPRELSRRIAATPEGTFMVIFDEALLLVRANDGAVLDSVRADSR